MEVSLLTNTTQQDLIEDITQGAFNDKLNVVSDNELVIKTQDNITILAEAAVEAGNKDALATLLGQGLKVTDALDIVIRSGKEELMDLVLDEITDKKTKKFILNECVYLAVKANKKDIITNLLHRGANINTNQRGKNTPIHTAITEKCDDDLLKHLINNDANTKTPNKKNKTALDLVNDFLCNSQNAPEEKEKFEKLKNLLIDKDYECSIGGPSVLSGFSYQIKYLTLYAIMNTKLAISNDCQYELSTEAMDLIPFDDIHLRITQRGRTRCEFVQVKQGKAEQYKFFAILNNDKNIKEHIKGNDSIVKMFIKFNKILDNPVYKNTSTEFIYCMNGNFQNESSNCFKYIRMVDDVVFCGVKRDEWIIDPKYLFIEMKYVILNLIGHSPYFTVMPDEFQNEINEQIQIIDNLIKEKVIDHISEELYSLKTIAEKGLKGIREYLEKYEINTNNAKGKKNMNDNFTDTHKLVPKKDLLKKESIMKLNSEKDLFLFFSKYNESEIKNRIDNFVNHFRVFTNCPSSDDLDKVIGEEIKTEFKVEIPKLITAFCIKYISEWISNYNKGKLQLFSESDGKKLFNNIRIQIFNEFNKSYIEELQIGNIHFEQTNEQVKTFLKSENNQRVLYVITQYTRLHTINIMQTLKTLNYLDKHSIYCENLERIMKSIDNCKIFFNEFYINIDLLIIECSDDAEKIESNILNILKNVLTTNARKKLIIIAGKENKIISSTKHMTNDHVSCNSSTLSFKDLTLQSQEMILNKAVCFQNNPNSIKTSLKTRDFLTISTACEVIDENIISNIIINNAVIQIGNDEAFMSYDYNSELYIPRHMVNGTIIPQNIKDKIVIVANNAGEGKSTMLTHLAHYMRNESENSWIIRVDLRNYTDNNVPNSLNSIRYNDEDTIKAIEHITRMVVETNSTDISNTLERKLLSVILRKYNRIGVILLIDGFDEISPSYKEKTCIMLKALAKSEVKQLWVTTRVHLKEYLEEQLQVTSHTMAGLTETEQVQFLCNFWKFNLRNNKFTQKPKEEEHNSEIFKLQRILIHNFKYIYNVGNYTITNSPIILQWKLLKFHNLIYDERTLQNLAQRSLWLWKNSMKNDDFLKIPLHLEMFAKNLMQREWKLLNIESLQLFEIYSDFIDNKLEIYYKKSTIRTGNQHAMDQSDITTVLLRKMHREIAVKNLIEHSFGSTSRRPVQPLPDLNVCSEHSNYLEMLIRAGLVKSYGNSVEFIHRTFAEYFFSEYLVTHLNHPYVQSTFLNNVLLDLDFQMVRKFLDRFLFHRRLPDKDQDQQIENPRYLYENILVQSVARAIINYKSYQDRYENVLHIAVGEGHVEIFSLIFKNISKKALVKLVMKNSSIMKYSLLHKCFLTNHLKMFVTIIDSIRELKIPMKIILDTSLKHFHNLIKSSSPHLVNYRIQRSVLKDRLMICDCYFGKSVLHMSVENGQSDFFEIIIKAAESCSALDELITKTDKDNKNVLHYAIQYGNIFAVHAIVKLIEENPKICKITLLQADISGHTVLHDAERLEICELILKTADKYEDVFKDLMMKRDVRGMTALHSAVSFQLTEISDIILKSAAKYTELLKHLIRVRANDGHTVLNEAIENNDDTSASLIFKYAVNGGDMFKELIMQCNNQYGTTALHFATRKRQSEIRCVILDYAKVERNIIKCLIAQRDIYGFTALKLYNFYTSLFYKSQYEFDIYGWERKSSVIAVITQDCIDLGDRFIATILQSHQALCIWLFRFKLRIKIISKCIRTKKCKYSRNHRSRIKRTHFYTTMLCKRSKLCGCILEINEFKEK